MKKQLLSFVGEDVSFGDITTALLEPKNVCAHIRVNENCVLAGMEEAKFLLQNAGIKVKAFAKDGQKVKKRKIVMLLYGNVKKILPLERTVCNVLGRMSGVATLCHKAQKIAGKRCKIMLTRKTMPGFNLFDKKAAHYGGALPHRLNLNEMVLIKDNHLIAAGSVSKILAKAIKKYKGKKKIEIEVSNMSEALEAAQLNPDVIMLDNFSVKNAKQTVNALKKAKFRGKIELSGGINLKNLKQYSKCGADFISMGMLTKRAPMIDFHLTVEK